MAWQGSTHYETVQPTTTKTIANMMMARKWQLETPSTLHSECPNRNQIVSEERAREISAQQFIALDRKSGRVKCSETNATLTFELTEIVCVCVFCALLKG